MAGRGRPKKSKEVSAEAEAAVEVMVDAVAEREAITDAVEEVVTAPVIKGLSKAEEYASKAQKVYGLDIISIDGDAIMFAKGSHRMVFNAAGYADYNAFARSVQLAGLAPLEL